MQKEVAAQAEEVAADAPVEGDLLDRVIAALSASSRHIALAAGWTATCGSLIFSEVFHWLPCELCWFQRILMYPLAPLIAMGILRNDRGLPLYVLPLSLTGMGVSLYHYLLIKTDIFPPPPCADGVPCTVDYLNILGFINIPFLALIAFLIISIMMGSYLVSQQNEEEGPETQPIAWRAAASPAQIGVLAVTALVIFTFIGIGAALV